MLDASRPWTVMLVGWNGSEHYGKVSQSSCITNYFLHTRCHHGVKAKVPRDIQYIFERSNCQSPAEFGSFATDAQFPG